MDDQRQSSEKLSKSLQTVAYQQQNNLRNMRRLLAAGAVLTPGKVVKSGQIWAGNPAKYFRDMNQAEKDYIKISADNYAELAREYYTSSKKD